MICVVKQKDKTLKYSTKASAKVSILKMKDSSNAFQQYMSMHLGVSFTNSTYDSNHAWVQSVK